MDLQRRSYRFYSAVQILPVLAFYFGLVSFSSLAAATPPSAAQKPGLIRDTDVADGVETVPEIKGPDPLLCEKNIKIGDFYYKRKNYDAAIRRYLEAIDYQTSSVKAYESLARAYEKNGDPDKAIAAYKQFIDNNPDSPKVPEFRAKLEKLGKKSR
jgi:tetratricopeptide (TPR) repeat protein